MLYIRPTYGDFQKWALGKILLTKESSENSLDSICQYATIMEMAYKMYNLITKTPPLGFKSLVRFVCQPGGGFCLLKGKAMEDMIKIKLAIEGMKAEIVKVFDVAAISAGVEQATEKALSEFDFESYVNRVIESVLRRAAEKATEELYSEYGSRLAEQVEAILEKKLEQALKET